MSVLTKEATHCQGTQHSILCMSMGMQFKAAPPQPLPLLHAHAGTAATVTATAARSHCHCCHRHCHCCHSHCCMLTLQSACREETCEQAAVLHYTYNRFEDLKSRRDRCDCAPTEDDAKRCFILPFDRSVSWLTWTHLMPLSHEALML